MKIELAALSHFAHDVADRVQPHHDRAFILTLSGELGAGKTTFMQAFARECGVEETVQSPTFALMKSYPIAFRGFSRLVHIDAYRLNGAGEFDALKPKQFLNDPHAIVCIEWPERIEGALPKADIALKFAHTEGESMREIEVVE